MSTIVVAHGDRLTRFAVQDPQAALSVYGRSVVVLDAAQLAEDLARDLTEAFTRLCVTGTAAAAPPGGRQPPSWRSRTNPAMRRGRAVIRAYLFALDSPGTPPPSDRAVR